MEEYMVSSEFSKTVAKYIKDKYNIDLCAYVTTKNLYTLLDLQAIQMETFLKDKELRQKRIQNFIRVGALKSCNTDNVFNTVAREWSSLDNGIIVITLPEIRSIFLDMPKDSTKKYSTETFTDCVIVSIIEENGAYMMIGDFVTFSII